MRKLKWPALGLGFVLALSVNVAEAQVNATVVLKDGEKHTGRNVGYRADRREVSVRTSQDQEPRVNVDQVAYIDFGGAPGKDVNLTGTQQAVVLRDGNVIRGQVIEIGHEDTADEKTPFNVIVRTEAGEERRLPVNQVGRVYFSSPGAVATSGKEEAQLQAATGDGIVVSARQQWTPTGMTVRSGDRVTFQTSGEIQLSNDAKDVAGPAGALSQRKAPGSPLEGNFAGALIGRVGTGEPFPIGGPSATVTMPAAGQLFLGINDDELSDNRGEFRVKIERAGRR
jgi:hypothetical protein